MIRLLIERKGEAGIRDAVALLRQGTPGQRLLQCQPELLSARAS
jgi:hypothetical protein